MTFFYRMCYLKCQVFQNVTQCRVVNSSYRIEAVTILRNVDICLQFTQRNTLEDFDLQLHRCENIKSCLIQGVSGRTYHSSGERSSCQNTSI
jgi:hypothetical protein